MPDALKEYGDLGLAVLIILGVGIWMWRGLWPFLIAQIETSQKRVDELAKQFSSAMEVQARAFEQALVELRKPRR